MRLAWTDSTINYNPYDDQRPLAIQGVVFPYNNTEYAINMSDGTKMFYKNSRVFFERLFGDSLLLFDTKKRAVVVNIFSGNIVLDIEKQYGAYNGYLVPNFVKGAVYVKTDKKELTSYETESGKIKWRFTTANAIYTLSLVVASATTFGGKCSLISKVRLKAKPA